MLYVFLSNILRATERHKQVRAVKSKHKVLRHLKVDPILKIDESFYKQPESMCELDINK